MIIMGILKKLHSEDVESHAKSIFDEICNKSEGVDVPAIREELGYSNEIKEITIMIKGIIWATKSKVLSFGFCNKKLQTGNVFGIRGEDNTTKRQGKNDHTGIELVYSRLNRILLIKLYKKAKSVKIYIFNRLKELVTDLIGGKSFDDALLKIDNSEKERDHYYESLKCTAERLSERFDMLANLVGISRVCEFFFPIFVEVEIYDYEKYLHGIIDAIYKSPFGGYIVVDNKFGQPKEKYYEDNICKELWFYKWLAESKSAYYFNEETRVMERWTPLYCSSGEMWYVMDAVSGTIKTNFNQKHEIQLLELLNDYWEALDNLSFEFKPKLGWKTNRYNRICNRLKNGKYICENRPICQLTDSFKRYVDSITLIGDEDNWKLDEI